ncbi:MAG: hypothetical protein CEN91_429, partial [Candidatus Berkelbacteria bacterium Licking1014_85]
MPELPTIENPEYEIEEMPDDDAEENDTGEIEEEKYANEDLGVDLYPSIGRAIQEFINLLSEPETIDRAFKIKEAYCLTNSPEAKRAAIKGLANCLLEGKIDYVLRIKQDLDLNEVEVQQAIGEWLGTSLSGGDFENALQILQELPKLNVDIRNLLLIMCGIVVDPYTSKLISIPSPFTIGFAIITGELTKDEMRVPYDKIKTLGINETLKRVWE